jgi:site-specific DNA recombinase
MTTRFPRSLPPPSPLQAAIYARVSSDQQAERQTIDSQISDLKAHAAQDGYAVPDEYLFIDNGVSGTGLVRPALERLRDLIALSAIDIVYVHAPDRLARSYAHQVILIEEFTRAGVQMIFHNRPIGDTPEDTLLLQLQGMFAEYERTRRLERSRRGKWHRAQEGSVSALGRAPYGFHYVSRDAGDGIAHFEIEEDQARVVRGIFEWVGAERLSLAAVCRRLAAAAIPSPTGKPRWSRAMVHTLLRNPAYVGRAIFGRRRNVPRQAPLHPPRGHVGPPKCRWRQIPADPDRYITVPVPVIVDDALFAATAEQLEENRRSNRVRLSGLYYLLSGLLVCRKCGYSFTGHHPPGPRRYYRCCGTDRNRFDGQRRCDTRMVATDPLDEAVWQEVCRLLEDPARVLTEYQRRLDTAQANPRQHDLDMTGRQIGKLRRAIDRLIDGYAEGFIAREEFEPRVVELHRRISTLEAKAVVLQSAAEEVRSLQLVIGKVSLFADMVRDRLEIADWATRRELICTLVKRIEIDDDTVRACLTDSPGGLLISVKRRLKCGQTKIVRNTRKMGDAIRAI